MTQFFRPKERATFCNRVQNQWRKEGESGAYPIFLIVFEVYRDMGVIPYGIRAMIEYFITQIKLKG